MHPQPCQENLRVRIARALAGRFEAIQGAPHRLAWAVRVRWLVIGGVACLSVLAHVWGLFASIQPCVQAAIVGALMNAVNAWCVARSRWVVAVTSVAIPLDHLLITYVVVNTGGLQSPFVMMYVVQVLATAMLVDTVVAAASAVLGMLTWVAGITLQATGMLAVPPLFSPNAPAQAIVYIGTWATYLLYSLALLVYLGGYISGRLRASERDLAERNREVQVALASLQVAHEELRTSYGRLQQAEAQLVQSEKMRGLGQLVAGVAHELNNPISFISANVEHLRTYVGRVQRALEAYASASLTVEERSRLHQLRAEIRVDEALADLPALLDDCEEGARRSKHIVDELRSFSRGDERDEFRLADVHRGIESTLALLAHRLKHGITVHRDFGDLPAVECHPDQLNQVFMNLLANAVDAIGTGSGNIWITTRAVQDAVSPNGAIRISVHDDGPGMTAEVQARLFEPFFTTKDVGQGTGLGLSVSYGIIQRHQGKVSVDSRPGGGATFIVTVPVKHPIVTA